MAEEDKTEKVLRLIKRKIIREKTNRYKESECRALYVPRRYMVS